MEQVVLFFIRNDVWIYILCGLGAFWYLSQMLRARQAYRRAIFGLERDRGLRRLQRAFTLLVIFLAIAGAVFYVNWQIAPTLPPELLRPPTPTLDSFLTPFASPTTAGVDAAPGVPTLAVAPTVTLRGQAPSIDTVTSVPDGVVVAPPTPVATPGAAFTPPAGNCSQGVRLTSPPPGVNVVGLVTFFGTTDVPSYATHSLEAMGPETSGTWRTLLQATVPVNDGILGSIDFGSWQDGSYMVRLSATNSAGEPVGQCAIQLLIGPGS
jgi:hypothetical protein